MIFISHRHPLVTIIHNFKIQFISILTTRTVRYVLAEKGFLCDSTAVLSVIQQTRDTLHTKHTWSDNNVLELIVVKVQYTSLLNTTVVAFKVLPLVSYTPMPAPSPPFKIILELVLWNCFRAATLLLLMS